MIVVARRVKWSKRLAKNSSFLSFRTASHRKPVQSRWRKCWSGSPRLGFELWQMPRSRITILFKQKSFTRNYSHETYPRTNTSKSTLHRRALGMGRKNKKKKKMLAAKHCTPTTPTLPPMLHQKFVCRQMLIQPKSQSHPSQRHQKEWVIEEKEKHESLEHGYNNNNNNNKTKQHKTT